MFIILYKHGRQNERYKEERTDLSRYYCNGAIEELFSIWIPLKSWVRKSYTFWKINPGLGYKKNLVGQAHDGATVTSGKHSGVQARVKEEAKCELYIHCSSKSLNLFLVDIAKAVTEAEFSP